MSIFIQMQRYPLLVTVEQAHLAVQLQDPHLHKEVGQSLHGSDLFTKLIYYVILVVVCICIEHDCYVLTSYFYTNTLLATVAFLLLPDTNLLPQAGITHYLQLDTTALY